MTLNDIKIYLDSCTEEQLQQDAVLLRAEMGGILINSVNALDEDYHLDGDVAWPKSSIDGFNEDINPLINKKGTIWFYG